MTDVFKGILAGGVATVALSALMLLISAAGVLPQLSLIHLLLVVLDAPKEHVLGWIMHFALGSVIWGSLFAPIEPRLGTDSQTKSGILFGVLLWLFMMLVFMPAAGAGYFGFQLTHVAPIVILLLHVVYGAVLGWTYGKLSQTHHPFMRHHAA
jgi:hypothetical protein